MTKMITKTAALAVGGVLAAAFVLAATASADTRNATYCDAVVQKYERYLGNASSKRQSPQGVETRQAVEACKQGDASGIAVIEKALQNAKIPLPPRG
jgi:hypothetical protein